jgi:hypothetical protein
MKITQVLPQTYQKAVSNPYTGKVIKTGRAIVSFWVYYRNSLRSIVGYLVMIGYNDIDSVAVRGFHCVMAAGSAIGGNNKVDTIRGGFFFNVFGLQTVSLPDSMGDIDGHISPCITKKFHQNNRRCDSIRIIIAED